MPLRKVIGKIYKVTGAPLINAKIPISLTKSAFDLNATYPQLSYLATTDNQGNIKDEVGGDLYLWCQDTSLVDAHYIFKLPDNKEVDIYLSYEDGSPIAFERLRATNTPPAQINDPELAVINQIVDEKLDDVIFGNSVTSVNGETGAVIITTSDITQDNDKFFVSATEKTTWGAKEPPITAGSSAQYIRGDKTLGNFASSVLAVALASVSFASGAAITASDTILSAFGKTQAQITANLATSNSALALKADLVGGLIPSSQLPSFVDDVLEFADLASFPGTGATGKIYVAIDTNKSYRWSGSIYVHLDDSVALGETSATAYRGDRGKTAFDHSQLVSGNPHNVTPTDLGLVIGTNVQAFNANLSAISALSPTNNDILQRKAGVWTNRTPAQFKTDLVLTSSDVGLGSVVNFDTTTTVNITDSTNKRFITDAERTAWNAKQTALGYTAENSANKDASGGYAGLTLLKINFKNTANTSTSFFTNSNTAARTYTFRDRDGTIADDTDLALKANLASPTFTGTVSGVSKSMVGLGNVENTALSTWAGTTNLTTLGTISTGSWNGSVISATYGGTGVNNGTKTITLGNNLTTSGNFALTLTQTAATNVTLPTTGTLATLIGTESFQNKTLDNTNSLTLKTNAFTLQDATTISKQLTFNLSGLTVSTTRVLTLPDATDTLLGRDTADTLTNKTISGVSNTITNLSASNLSSGTVGTARLGTGTASSSTYLRGDGTWATPSGGGGGTTFADNVFAVQNSSDATKQIAFSASGIATGTTRTFTVPNVSDTLAVIGTAQTFSAAQTFSSQIINTLNGALSTPPVSITGTWVASGGTSTTTKPQFLIEPSGTTSTAWNTAGTAIAANSGSSFTGNLLDLQKNGVSQLKVAYDGTLITLSSVNAYAFAATVSVFTGYLSIGNNSRLYSSASGVLAISNPGQTDFTRLQFGSTTNSFNAIGRDAVNGFTIQSAAGTATYNDPSTAASGTVAERYLFGIAAPTLTATNTGVTDTIASSFYIGGAPAASTNTTIGTAYALRIAAGNFGLGDSGNIVFGTSTGTKIGTATSQKIGFWNATPIVQPTTAISASTFAANTAGTLNDSATFDGYTIGQVVKALRNIGVLA